MKTTYLCDVWLRNHCVTVFIYCVVVVATSNSYSAASDDVRQVTVASKVPVTAMTLDESIESCQQQHKFSVDEASLTSKNSEMRNETREMSISCRLASDADAPERKPSRQRNRRTRRSRASPVCMKNNVCDDVPTAADACRTSSRRTEETVTGDVVDGGTAHVGRDGHLQPQKMSRGACDILAIIDDSCSSRQRCTDIVSRETVGSLSEVDKVRQSGTCVKLDDVTLMNSPTDEADHRATAESGRSLQKASTEATKIQQKRTRSRQVILGRAGKQKQATPRRPGNVVAGSADNLEQTTPGRIGNLKQITPGHGGNLEQTAPGTAPGHGGNLEQTTPGRIGNLKQTTPGRIGNLKQTTPAHGGNLVQSTPGRVGTKRKPCRSACVVTPVVGRHCLALTADVIVSPGNGRLFGSSPAVKRNAKGETSLHRAAIKVTFMTVTICWAQFFDI